MNSVKSAVRSIGRERSIGSFIGFVLLCSVFSAAPLFAAFEDIGLGARSRGLSDSVTALGDAGASVLNPAVIGGARKFETATHFEAGTRSSLGPKEFDSYAFNMTVPGMTYGKLGTFSLIGRYSDVAGLSREKSFGIGYGTWQFLKTRMGVVDFGVNLKAMQLAAAASGDSAMGLGVDLGALWRADSRHNLGLSILNVNSPSFNIDSAGDKAPLAVRLGVAETAEDYTVSMDVARRSAAGGYPASVSLNSGFEYLWRTYRYGIFCSRTGLSLAERASSLSLGIGYKHLASELSYSLILPVTGGIVPGHALSLNIRFGDKDIESEYEKLMKQEIKYRRDLVEALDESSRRENILKDEMNSLKGETDALRDEIGVLNLRLKSEQDQKAETAAAKEKLEAIMARQRKAQIELKDLEEKRRRDKLAQLQFDFSRDWQSYLKLKGGGAPKEVLKGSLQRLIGQYQSAGIDISPATVELQGLVGAGE